MGGARLRQADAQGKDASPRRIIWTRAGSMLFVGRPFWGRCKIRAVFLSKRERCGGGGEGSDLGRLCAELGRGISTKVEPHSKIDGSTLSGDTSGDADGWEEIALSECSGKRKLPNSSHYMDARPRAIRVCLFAWFAVVFAVMLST